MLVRHKFNFGLSLCPSFYCKRLHSASFKIFKICTGHEVSTKIRNLWYSMANIFCNEVRFIPIPILVFSKLVWPMLHRLCILYRLIFKTPVLRMGVLHFELTVTLQYSRFIWQCIFVCRVHSVNYCVNSFLDNWLKDELTQYKFIQNWINSEFSLD